MSGYFEEKIKQINHDCQKKYIPDASKYANGALCHQKELHKINSLAETKATCSDIRGKPNDLPDSCSKSTKPLSDQIKKMGAWKNVPGGPEILRYFSEEY